MEPYEDDQYPTIYKDENYAIWIDIAEQVVNIFFRARGLTLHFTYEDFRIFREFVNSLIWVDTDEQMIDVYLEESELTLHFAYEDFEAFRDILDSLELVPKWWIYWN
jgi:hypothetical protein